MPASASPLVTLVTTPLTLVSSDLGLAVTLALDRASRPYFPHGTSGAQSTKLILAKSARLFTFLGFPLATMMASLLWVNTLGPVALPVSVTFFMLAWSAEANTSAGAPLLAWVASADEASKLKVTLLPGCFASKAAPSSLNDSLSEAAARTVRFPAEAAVVAVALVLVDADSFGLSSPQAAPRPRTSVSTSARPSDERRRAITSTTPLSSRIETTARAILKFGRKGVVDRNVRPNGRRSLSPLLAAMVLGTAFL